MFGTRPMRETVQVLIERFGVRPTDEIDGSIAALLTEFADLRERVEALERDDREEDPARWTAD